MATASELLHLAAEVLALDDLAHCPHAVPQANSCLHGICIFCWRDRLARARSSRNALAAAVVKLMPFVQHKDNCGHTYWELCGEDPKGRCDCGLDTALSSIGEGEA